MISGKAAENEPGWIKKHISTETIYTEIAAPLLPCRAEHGGGGGEGGGLEWKCMKV